MISVTSVTKNYILQPSLIEKHRKTLNWLSATLLWHREFAFFQKVLDQNAPKLTTVEDKKIIGHLQSLITYYSNEVLIDLQKKLRDHEHRLAEMLKTRDELKTGYFKEHDALMLELDTFNNTFSDFKEEFFEFIEKAMTVKQE